MHLRGGAIFPFPLLVGLLACTVCEGTENLNLVQELDAATVDVILHVKRKPEPRCTLACDYGVKQDQGDEYSVLSLVACQLDIHEEYEQQDPEQPGRDGLPGARIACEGTSFVQYDVCD